MNIPKNWTFQNKEVAANFDSHVREQLPWYDIATQAVAHLGRHYIPRGGRVYDIGASTGNIGNALRNTLEERNATFTAIEESAEMAAHYDGPESLIVSSALDYEFQDYDFTVCFLVLMFLPIIERRRFIERLIDKIRPGGALVIVDKIVTPSGYVGTSLRRLAMAWKRDNGATDEEIISKELSLSGYQRPVDAKYFEARGEIFFSLGEFRGWVIERVE